MLVFLVTVIIVAGLLALDRFYSVYKNKPKYTNLDWEILCYKYNFYGHIYSVVKNKVKTVHITRNFMDKDVTEVYTKKIYHVMRAEYGLANETSEKNYLSHDN